MNLFKYHDYSNAGCHDIMGDELRTQEELTEEIQVLANALAKSHILLQEAIVLATYHSNHCELVLETYSEENVENHDNDELEKKYNEQSTEFENQTLEQLEELKTDKSTSKKTFIEAITKIAEQAWEENYLNTSNIIDTTNAKDAQTSVNPTLYVQDEVPF